MCLQRIYVDAGTRAGVYMDEAGVEDVDFRAMWMLDDMRWSDRSMLG